MLPNLPGFNFPQYKERHHKAQTWNIHNGQRVEQVEGLTHDKPKFVRGAKPVDTWRTGSLPDSTSREVMRAGVGPKDFDELPAWDALDRHVLRFYGYFKEAVVEANLENFRVRKVVIFYYLEDDTAHITEPREDNSGIPQGTLVRRHRFPSPNGGYIKPEDFSVGCDFHIYGKTMHITDCDAFTREYYARQGIDQPMPSERPNDPFGQTRNEMKVENAKQPRTYEKLYREVMLGGGHINTDQQQFMENDRKVIRFYAVMDDISTPQFERRPFAILYFLADDTVEIREQYPMNCGRDNFPIFFRRGPLPKGGAVTANGPQDKPRKKEDSMLITDFSVGQRISLLNYEFFLYDADIFSRDYFDRVVGHPLGPKLDVRLPDRTVPRASTPPYTGYGSWDDSMSSVLNLIPKAPRKDYNKLFNNDGKILRFTARYVDPKPEDVERMFVVNFHLFDDTLSIHEPPQRNLGIVTGKFLEKGVHMNQETGKLFTPEDLMPGKRISVFNHRFEIFDMDEFTAKVLSGNAHRDLDLAAVLEKLRESMRQQFPLVRDIFRKFDNDHDGVITFKEFSAALKKFGFPLSEDEMMCIMRHFDGRQDGQVTYNEFCDVLLDEDYTMNMLECKPGIDLTSDRAYAERALMKTEERDETNKVRKAMRELGEIVYKHPGTLQRVLKEFTHMTHKNTVNSAQVLKAFTELGHGILLADVERCILFLFPDADLSCIDYVEFVKALRTSYHDVTAIR